MGKCVVKECNSRSQKDKKANGVTFHTIPKHPQRQEQWIKNIRLLRKETDWLPSKSTVICSHHFREEDKIHPNTDKGRVYLSDDAVPLYEDYNFEAYSPPDSNQMLESVETDDDIEKITESLKDQQMRRKIERLQTVSRRRLKKIKNLEQKTRRLKARNQYLKDVIKELKKNVRYFKMRPKRRLNIANEDREVTTNTEGEEEEEDEAQVTKTL